MKNSKFLIVLSALAFLVSGVSAADSNTSEVFNASDFTVEDSWKGEPFTAESLANLSANISLDTNESLQATVTGYNSSAETGNQSWDLTDGSNEKSISSFSENTSTFVLGLNASNGTVSVLDLEVTGTEGNTTVSGAAPGGGGLFNGITGAFSSGISGIWTWITGFFWGIFEAIGGFFGGLIA